MVMARRISVEEARPNLVNSSPGFDLQVIATWCLFHYDKLSAVTSFLFSESHDVHTLTPSFPANYRRRLHPLRRTNAHPSASLWSQRTYQPRLRRLQESRHAEHGRLPHRR